MNRSRISAASRCLDEGRGIREPEERAVGVGNQDVFGLVLQLDDAADGLVSELGLDARAFEIHEDFEVVLGGGLLLVH